MSVFLSEGAITPSLEETFKDPDALMEAFLIDEAQNTWTEEQVQEFCAEGGVGQALCEAKKISRKTIVRLSKKDDLARRTTIACLQLAKENNDTLWKKLIINRGRKRQLVAAIKKKYSNKANKVARVAQKDYLKGGKNKKGFIASVGKKED